MNRGSVWDVLDGPSVFDRRRALVRGSTRISVRDHCLATQSADLLRNVSACVVLHNFGCILQDSHGSRDTNDLSAGAERIDVFLSHNWFNGRLPKFLVWAIYFNSGKAFGFAMGVMCWACVLTATGNFHSIWINEEKRSGVMCWILTLPAFVVGLLCGHELEYFFGIRGRTVFLDKICIDQVDEERKRRGISQLGGFIARSSDMAVCLGDKYMAKLWTVYELATFLLVKRQPVILLPLSLPRIVLLLLLQAYVLSVGKYNWLTASLSGDHISPAISAVCVRISSVLILDSHSRLRDTAERFELEKAECFNPDDRRLVEDNIIEMMKQAGRAKRSDDREESIKAFNTLIREQVPAYLKHSAGRVGIPGIWVVGTCALAILPHRLDTWAASVRFLPIRTSILSLVHVLAKTLILVPFWYVLESLCVKACLREHLRRLALAVSLPMSALCLWGLNRISKSLFTRCLDSYIWLTVFVLFHSCVASVNVWAYQRLKFDYDEAELGKKPAKGATIEMHDLHHDSGQGCRGHVA